jgi:hypothetical protein
MRKLCMSAALVAMSAFSTHPVFAANKLDSQKHMTKPVGEPGRQRKIYGGNGFEPASHLDT